MALLSKPVWRIMSGKSVNLNIMMHRWPKRETRHLRFALLETHCHSLFFDWKTIQCILLKNNVIFLLSYQNILLARNLACFPWKNYNRGGNVETPQWRYAILHFCHEYADKKTNFFCIYPFHYLKNELLKLCCRIP